MLTLLGGLGTFDAAALAAQATTDVPASSASAPVTSSTASIGRSTPDTSVLIMGHRDFYRYTTPTLCLEAVERELMTAHRTLAAQTAAAAAQRFPDRDTLPTNVVMVARHCLLHVPIQPTAARELPSMFTLALAAGEDSVAHQVLMRQLALLPSDTQRTSALTVALNGYMRALPARVAAARALVAQAAGSASATRLWLALQMALLQRQILKRSDAADPVLRADSVLRFVSDGHAVDLSASEKQYVVRISYQTLMRAEYLAHVDAPDTVLDSVVVHLVQRAKDDLSRIVPDTTWYDPQASPQRTGSRGAVVAAAGRSAAAMRAAGYQMRVDGIDWHTVSVGKVARLIVPAGSVVLNDTARHRRPIPALMWFPPGIETRSDSPATVEFRYHLGDGCLAQYDAPLWNAACSTPLVQLQHWQQIYGNKLRMTVIARMHGHALYAGPQTPAEEAHTIAWYVRDYWHLPAAVALLPSRTPTEQPWQSDTSEPELEVIDEAGRVLYRGDVLEAGTQDEIAPLLLAVLAHVFTSFEASVP